MKCSGWCGDGENGGFYGGLIQYRVVTKIFYRKVKNTEPGQKCSIGSCMGPEGLPKNVGKTLVLLILAMVTSLQQRGDKGQLISKCPFGVIVWNKISMKKYDKFLP